MPDDVYRFWNAPFASGTKLCGQLSTSNTLTVSQNSLGSNIGFVYDSSDTTLYIYGEGRTNDGIASVKTYSQYKTTALNLIVGDICNLNAKDLEEKANS